MRYVILVLLVVILISLGSGLFYLVKDKGSTDRTARALTWRIGLSLLLFILIALSYRMGWVSGHLLS
ncbi:MAG TPA: twin transmembrane helix small protein [Rhodocyclaceae bacterium]|nr:twin transmembrane helix small protein [Rhodocyclaceae bacterium]